NSRALGSMATWTVNSREHNGPHTFVSCDFTLVATVVIQNFSRLSTPLPGAGLDAPVSTNFIGLSYGMDKTWETVFYGNKNSIGQHLGVGERIPGGAHAAGRPQGMCVREW
ncbi:putative trans-sialidase, partial [Trypanosoma cruzi]